MPQLTGETTIAPTVYLAGRADRCYVVAVAITTVLASFEDSAKEQGVAVDWTTLAVAAGLPEDDNGGLYLTASVDTTEELRPVPASTAVDRFRDARGW